MGITHAFTSSKDQSGDASLVSKNEWNADHVGSGVGVPGRYGFTNSTYSTTSGSFAAITSASDLTVTVGASGLVWVIGCLNIASSLNSIADCVVGIGVGAGSGTVAGGHGFNNTSRSPVPLGYILTGLSQGSHTLKLYWYQVGGTTLSIDGSTRGASYQGSWWQALPL